jgi:PAS domain-containing protein
VKKNISGSAFQLVHDKNQRSGVIVSDVTSQSEPKQSVTQMVAVQSLEKYPLILSFAVDEDFYLEDWKKTSVSIAIVAAGAVIAVIIAFYMLINLFLQRERDMQVMTDLKRDADKINLKQNELLINLTEQQKAIKESSDRLQAIFQNAADGIVMVDETGQVEAMNP